MKFPFFSSLDSRGPRRTRRSGFTTLDIPAITNQPSTRPAAFAPRSVAPPFDADQIPEDFAQTTLIRAGSGADSGAGNTAGKRAAAPADDHTADNAANAVYEDPWPPEPDFLDVPPPGTIGDILVTARRISVADARRIVASQIEFNEPFGETAIRLGLATRADVQFALSRQFAMPCLQEGDAAVDPEVIAAFHPGHELVERLRNLRGQIALRALDATPPLRSLAVMGTERGVGRSFIAANLATVFAQLGARTLLIDADLAHPRQHQLFRLNNRVGLSTMLAGRAKLNAVVPVPGVPGFAVLPSGPLPPNPDDLLARPTLAHLLRRCEHDFDVIVLDTPCWRQGTGARMIAAAAGAAVLLVQEGKTGAGDASDVGQELENVSAKLLGVVLNRP